ncbi:LysR family transcriptional regulator [Leucobacter sp. NPDC058333]|uniref:LysR family transcriptional regulator n=1 Tax=Leucobacter sp. NPDC058333 TaxID=3346450 RepID=UPI003651FA91
MLEMKRLRLLWELDARGTVAAVAEALKYSPSAISQQLALLEREAGVPLLRRVGRTLELTPAAHALVAETQELLAGLERAESALHRAHAEVGGTVRLAVFQTALLALMPQVLGRLRESHPSLRVEMVQHEPEAGLEETWTRGFDLVVAEQYPGHAAPHFPGLDRQPLIADRIRMGLPERGIGDAAFDAVTTLADAAELPWVLEPAGAASRHWTLQACRSAGFEPDVRYETADLQAHVRLIETGNAVALLPGLLHAGTARGMRLLDLAGDPERAVFTAARASSRGHPAVAAVREALRTEAELLAASESGDSA